MNRSIPHITRWQGSWVVVRSVHGSTPADYSALAFVNRLNKAR